MVKRGHPPSKAVVFHDNEAVVVPPGAIGMFGEGEGERPFSEEGGGVTLSSGAEEIKIRGREGSCEEVIGKGCDVGVVSSAVGVVRAARKSIGAIGGAGFMDEGDVVVAKCKNITGDTSIDMLGGAIILEVLVVRDNSDAMSGAHEEVAPVLEAPNDGEELSIPDGVVSFGLGESL